MLVYAVMPGGRYVPIEESLRLVPEGKRGFYINLTNQCNLQCTFCLRHLKEMAKESSLWLEKEGTAKEIKAAIATIPFAYASEIVVCGFGEPTLRLDDLIEILRYIRKIQPTIPTRLNTNGLANVEYGRDITPLFEGLLDTISISLNSPDAKEYAEITQSPYGIKSQAELLDFAQKCKAYIPNVVLTVVDQVMSPEQIAKARELVEGYGLTLRVRPYEDN